MTKLNLNKGISTSTGVLIIVVCALLAGGIFAWQYKSITKESKLTDTEKIEKTQTQDETADWKTYRNEEYGFEIKYPKETMHARGFCEWIDTENSYRPKEAIVPVKIFEDIDNNIVYIANEYYYELTDEIRENGTRFLKCNKKLNSLDLVKNNCLQDAYQGCWKVVVKDVTNDKELREFIKEYYGYGCDLGERIPTEQEGVYDIKIKGDGKSLEFTKCPMTFGVALKYYPEKNKVISWRFSVQAPTFYKYHQLRGEYDSEMVKSFRFIR